MNNLDDAIISDFEKLSVENRTIKLYKLMMYVVDQVNNRFKETDHNIFTSARAHNHIVDRISILEKELLNNKDK